MTSASAEAPRSLQAILSALSDDEIPRLICDEPAFIDIVSQDAIQYVDMSKRGGTIKVGVKHIESLKPEYQRINVAYQNSTSYFMKAISFSGEALTNSSDI